MAYKTCFSCNRGFCQESFRKLTFDQFHEFGAAFLECRICTCGTRISVEHDPMSLEPWMTAYLQPRQIALKSNKGGRY